MQSTRNDSIRRARRGFTITEAAAVAAVVAVAAAVTVPVFRRVGCSSMREQSMSQLATLAAAHAQYTADFNGRQFTACPDDLGAFGGGAGRPVCRHHDDLHLGHHGAAQGSSAPVW